MVENKAYDARAEDELPKRVERLHEVERDLFATDKVSEITLPPWIANGP